MAGLSIFMHAVRMVLGNLGPALRIGFLPQLLLVVVGWFFAGRNQHAMMDTAGMPVMPDAGALTGGLVMVVAQMLIALWVAVAWHRYILLEEQPGAFLPGWNGAAIWSYFKAGFVLAVVILIIAIPLTFVAGIIGAPLLLAGSGILAALILFVIVGVPLSWVGYRLSPILPAAAIGERRTLAEAWAATSPASGAVIALALISVVAVWLLQMPALWLAFAAPILAMVWGVLTNWLIVMVGVGIITTIFGHYVQGRPLNV